MNYKLQHSLKATVMDTLEKSEYNRACSLFIKQHLEHLSIPLYDYTSFAYINFSSK